MAKVSFPLFSYGASGNFAGAIQFICGEFVKAPGGWGGTPTKLQGAERKQFLNGAKKWSDDLSWATKQKWTALRHATMVSGKCLGGMLSVSGYNLWMLYWLKFGEDGWKDYPDPPTG